MTLYPPFAISARLCPAVRISDAHSCAWLSFDTDQGQFVLDLPDGSEHWIIDFRAGAASDLPSQFAAVLGFLAACAESRRYATSQGKDPMAGENSDLFPAAVGEWAESVSDEIGMLECEIKESGNPLIDA